jgi:putative ABC transport system permease protein
MNLSLNDIIRLGGSALWTQPLRSFLTALGITIGVAAVVLLTSIGAGVNRYILEEFSQFGTNIIGINPGRTTTHGTSIGIFGNTRPLTLDDAAALRRIPHVEAVVPVLQGNAEIEARGRQRRTTVYGAGHQLPQALRFQVGSGRFLPPDDPHAARAFAVLGSTLQRELFGEANPLGEHIRVGGYRYLVIGTMQSKGQLLGVDLDDSIFIPAARALELFNRDSLMEIDVLYNEGASADEVVAGVKRMLGKRHGREDFTIITQQQMLDVLGSVLDVLTFAVAALGGISLLVGGVGILTIMIIGVTERTGEVGLLRALGAYRSHVLVLFLGEALALSAAGGSAGLVLGVGGAELLHLAVPALPVHISWLYVAAAEAVAVIIGLAAGIYPAHRAAELNPVEALRTE